MASPSSQNCATKPDRLTAPAQRTLPPARPPPTERVRTPSLPNQAARTPGRVRPSLACARARPRRAQPRSRSPPSAGPVRSARSLPRSIGPTRRRRLGPARLLVLARRRPSVEEGRLGGGCCGGARGAGGGRAQVPATSPAVEARAPRGAARSRLRAQEVGEGLVGPAYPAAWRSLRSPWRPGGLAPAAPRPRRRLLLHEPSGVGEGGDPTTLLKSAGSPSSHAGGRRRRQTHKEGGERTPRGRAGAGGAAAWIGPARGEVGVSGLRLVERWSFSLRVGIGRTVRPGDEMAAGPGELGGVAARTSFVTARTALPSRRGGGYRAKSVTQSERPAHWLTVTESSLSASSCRGIGWSDSSPSPRDRLLRGGGLRKTGGEAGTETEAVRMRSGAQRPE